MARTNANNEKFEQDIEFLRDCQKRLGRVIQAIEHIPTLAVREPEQNPELPPGIYSLAAIEREAIAKTMQVFHGDVLRAASALGIAKTTLYRRLKAEKML